MDMKLYSGVTFYFHIPLALAQNWMFEFGGQIFTMHSIGTGISWRLRDIIFG